MQQTVMYYYLSSLKPTEVAVVHTLDASSFLFRCFSFLFIFLYSMRRKKPVQAQNMENNDSDLREHEGKNYYIIG